MHLSQCAAGNWMSFVVFQMYYLKFIRLDIYNNNNNNNNSWRRKSARRQTHMVEMNVSLMQETKCTSHSVLLGTGCRL